MSSPASPSGSISVPSSTPEIRVLYPLQWPWSNYKSAHVLVSSRIYWKETKKDGSNQPQSVLDFQNTNSLELVRLDEGSWKDVDEIVREDDYDGRPRITVRGRLHGRTRLKKLFLVRNVDIEIILNTPKQREVWVKRLRSLVAPWTLLKQEMKNSSGVEDIEIALGGLAGSAVASKFSSTLADNVDERWSDGLAALPEQMQKLSVVEKLTTHGAAAVRLGGTLSKLISSAEGVTETAELLANLSKCVAGVSTIFQLVSLIAQGVSMWAEASRGQRALPVALGQITILLRYAQESLSEINKPSRNMNDTVKDFVFNTLKETVCIMMDAETQLLRGRGSQIMNAEDVKKVEEKLEDLIHRVVTSGAISMIFAVHEKVNQLQERREIRSDGPHHVRLSVSAFFSGRKKELKSLKEILEKRGSAVITQYGGVGKSELMTTFADRAERDRQVPGGVFWVTVDGGVRDVTVSLARLVEKLTLRQMSEEERQNANSVIASLKQGLAQKQGRWLLCLDNADDNKVSGILRDVCDLGEPMRQNGWVLVTSRQGQPRVWAGMKSDQKLILEPLCAEDAMVGLWRQSKVMKIGDSDDDGVKEEIKKLEGVDPDEYRALEELCGDGGNYSLGGLPLALVQAGTYIARFECTFKDYLNLFKSENLQDIMKNSEAPTAIRESQRSIWTTWKISVLRLSEEAYAILGAMAMLGQAPIDQTIVRRIMTAAMLHDRRTVKMMFSNVITEELVQGSSLICRDERRGQQKAMYRMHRLVRRFILNEMLCESDLWNYVYSLALPAVHDGVESELRKESKSFCELPDVFENNHREFMAHSLALVHNHMLPASGGQIQDFSKVKDIHEYSGKLMRFMGKSHEEVQVWEHLQAILHHQQVENRSIRFSGRLLDMWHRRKREKEVEICLSRVYNSLGIALEISGKLNSAVLKLKSSLQMRRTIHGHGKAHPDIASSLNNLGNVYLKMGEQDKALEKQKESLKMKRVIHGGSKPHPAIASSLDNLGIVYLKMGELGEALEKHEESLEMKRVIHGGSKLHPAIASSLDNLGNVYLKMGELGKALEKHEESLEMRRTIHGHRKAHPDIASSLNNLGNVYLEMRELHKALEKYEESLDMERMIRGGSKSHPAIASSLQNLGIVYLKMGELDKSLEKHEESLEMKRVIHGGSKPHPDIASSLDNLGLVYRKMGQLDKAIEKHEESLAMSREIHGHGKPHSDTAITLWNIGLVYRVQKNQNRAVEFFQQSLEMLEIVHGQNSGHSHIAAVHSALSKLREGQDRKKC